MTLKEKIENNPIIWFLSAILIGFMAGIATYEGILKIAKLKVVPKSEIVETSQQKMVKGKATTITLNAMSVSEVLPDLNIALGYFGTDFDYEEINKAFHLTVNWPKKYGMKISREDFGTEGKLNFKMIWVESKTVSYFSLGHLGQYAIQVKDFSFDSDGKPIRLLVEVSKME